MCCRPSSRTDPASAIGPLARRHRSERNVVATVAPSTAPRRWCTWWANTCQCRRCAAVGARNGVLITKSSDSTHCVGRVDDTDQFQNARLVHQHTQHKESRIEWRILVRQNITMIVHCVRLREAETFFFVHLLVFENCTNFGPERKQF